MPGSKIQRLPFSISEVLTQQPVVFSHFWITGVADQSFQNYPDKLRAQCSHNFPIIITWTIKWLQMTKTKKTTKLLKLNSKSLSVILGRSREQTFNESELLFPDRKKNRRTPLPETYLAHNAFLHNASSSRCQGLPSNWYFWSSGSGPHVCFGTARMLLSFDNSIDSSFLKKVMQRKVWRLTTWIANTLGWRGKILPLVWTFPALLTICYLSSNNFQGTVSYF